MSKAGDNNQRKGELASRIGSILFRLDLSIGQSAKRLGITQTEVSRLLRHEIDGFTVEQLETFLQEVER